MPIIETREHIQSYYAATANWQTHYPALQGNMTADVCVIGGGFSGVSTALHLVEKGFNVTLLEANRIGWGASGRNGGQVIASIGSSAQLFGKSVGEEAARTAAHMGVEAVEIIKNRVSQYNIKCDLTFGYYYTAIKKRHNKLFVQMKADGEKYNSLTSQLLDKHQIQDIIKTDLYCGALAIQNWGHVHPLNLCIGEAHAAGQLGAHIFEQSKAIKITHGKKAIVHTEQGSVTADFVVLCGESYMEGLAPQIEKYTAPIVDYIVVTKPLTIDQQIITQNYAVCDANFFLNYWRMTPDNRLLFGGSGRLATIPPHDATAMMRKRIARVFPQLQHVDIDYMWSGQMALSMNQSPQLGRVADNIYYVQGYTGDGVAPTHIMGKILSEVVSGQAERFDFWRQIKHKTFLGNANMRRHSVALGKLYYMLLDLL